MTTTTQPGTFRLTDDAALEVRAAKRELATAEARVCRAHIATIDVKTREQFPAAVAIIIAVHRTIGDISVAKVANTEGFDLRPPRRVQDGPSDFDLSVAGHVAAIRGRVDAWLPEVINPAERVRDASASHRYYELDLTVPARSLYDVRPVVPHTT